MMTKRVRLSWVAMMVAAIFFIADAFSVTASAAQKVEPSKLEMTAESTSPVKGSTGKSSNPMRDASDEAKEAAETVADASKTEDVSDKSDDKEDNKSSEEKETVKSGRDVIAAEQKRKKRDFSAKPEKMIRVGLATGQSMAAISAGDGFVVRDESTGKGLEQRGKGETLMVTVRDHQMMLNGKAVSARKIRIATADDRSSMRLTYAGNPYHGEFVIVLDGNTLTVINEVGIDDYIGGVVDEEMGADWPIEALKAQTVAARTFAMYSMKRHDDEGFDVCATTHCQVYGGISSESRNGLSAVSATRGEIMVYDDKPIYAAFHASAGGWTAGSDEMGLDAVPYLKSVRSDDTFAPGCHWQEEVSVNDLSIALRSNGYAIGKLKKIELSPLDDEKVSKKSEMAGRYPSGHVKTVKFIGSNKTVEVDGYELRSMFGLNSTCFDIRYGTKSSSKPNTKGVIEIKHPATDHIVFDGYGMGHGMGMSQWGAYKMAQTKGYRDILNHYYTNISFKKLF